MPIHTDGTANLRTSYAVGAEKVGLLMEPGPPQESGLKGGWGALGPEFMGVMQVKEQKRDIPGSLGSTEAFEEVGGIKTDVGGQGIQESYFAAEGDRGEGSITQRSGRFTGESI